MSHFTEIETRFKDVDCLLKALKEVVNPKTKKPFQQIDHYSTAKNLKGYKGDTRPQTAEIIIHKKFIGCLSNDIGFKKQSNGEYIAYISEYDSKQVGFNESWVNQIKVKYAEKVIEKQAQQLGVEVSRSVLSNGKIQYRLVKRNQRKRANKQQMQKLQNIGK